MASTTATSSNRLVATYVERVQADKRAADAAGRAEKEKQADARLDEIRSNSELANQLKRTPTEANKANEAPIASSSSQPGRRKQGVAEIDGRAVPTSSALPSNVQLPPTSGQSRTTSLAVMTNDRIQVLESQLESQNTRIQELEAARVKLAHQLTDLQTSRDKAEQELIDATIAGTAAKEEQEKIVEGLRQQIERLIVDRKDKERQIEELRDIERELRRQLHEERQKVGRLEVEKEALERPDDSAAAPVVAASTVSASSRRGSVGESERRRNGHGRTHSSGSSINFRLQAELDFGKGKKKKKGSRK